MEKYGLFFPQNTASSITKYVHSSTTQFFLFKCSTYVILLLPDPLSVFILPQKGPCCSDTSTPSMVSRPAL
jgi:hypothetical protein